MFLIRMRLSLFYNIKLALSNSIAILEYVITHVFKLINFAFIALTFLTKCHLVEIVLTSVEWVYYMVLGISCDDH